MMRGGNHFTGGDLTKDVALGEVLLFAPTYLAGMHMRRKERTNDRGIVSQPTQLTTFSQRIGPLSKTGIPVVFALALPRTRQARK